MRRMLRQQELVLAGKHGKESEGQPEHSDADTAEDDQPPGHLVGWIAILNQIVEPSDQNTENGIEKNGGEEHGGYGIMIGPPERF
jgi:hypothetical protein